jgi:hypothetical protein
MERSTLSVAVSDLLDSEMREPRLPPGWLSPEEAGDVAGGFRQLRQAALQIKAARTTGGKRDDKQAEKLQLMVRIAEFSDWLAQQQPANGWELESPARRQLIVQIQAAAKADGLKSIRVQKNTPDATLIARGVFGTDRKLAHIFSTTIQHAVEEGVGPDGLSAWVKERGGLSTFSKQDALSRMWGTPPLATIKLDRSIIGEQVGETPKVILVTVRASGEVDVRCVVEDKAAAGRALSAWNA